MVAPVHLLHLFEHARHGGTEVLLETALPSTAQGELCPRVQGLQVLGPHDPDVHADVGLLTGQRLTVLAEQALVLGDVVAEDEGLGVQGAEGALRAREGGDVLLVRLLVAPEHPQGDPEVVPGDEGEELVLAEQTPGLGDDVALHPLRLLVLTEEAEVAGDGDVRTERAERVGGLGLVEAGAQGEIELVRVTEASVVAQDGALLAGELLHLGAHRVHEGGPVLPDPLRERILEPGIRRCGSSSADS